MAFIVQLLGFIFMVAGTHGAFSAQPNPPTTTDFVSFYAAGELANRGMPDAVYDEAAHRAVEGQVIAPGVEEKRFLYPPVFLIICAPLARLPYLVSFVLFEACGIIIWLIVSMRISGGGTTTAIAFLTIPSVWWTVGWGQNSFLSAALMGGGTLLVRKRPFAAGITFSALCFKPHFALLIPIALVAGRHWRALFGMVIGVSLLMIISVQLFGLVSWQAFLRMARHARHTIETGIQLSGHVDLGGAARLLGVPAGPSWVLQTLSSATAAICVAWLWHRSRCRQVRDQKNEALAYAGLVAGSLAAMPFVLFYDLVMASIAVSWLVRVARLESWRSNEMSLLCLLGCLNVVAFPSATLIHLAVGSLIPLLLMALVMRRSLYRFQHE